MPITYVNIASTTLGSSQSGVTFSSIAQTYTDLVLRISSRSDSISNWEDIFALYFNNNQGANNYNNTNLYNYAGTAGSNSNLNRTNMLNYGGVGGAATASTFGNYELYIPNYTNTRRKVSSGFGVTENNSTSSVIGVHSNFYRNFEAINRIDITFASGNNFVSGSSFYLYGVKRN